MTEAVAQPGQWVSEGSVVRPRNLWRLAGQRFARNRLALIGAIFLLLVAVMAAAPGLFAHYEADEPHFEDAWQGPSAKYWFGTDALGRDVYSRIIYGIQTSMIVGLSTMLIILVVGIGLGAWAGVRAGKADFLIMRLVDVMTSFPALLFTILLMATLGVGLQNVVIAIAIPGWVVLCQITRAQILSLRERQFVEAAEMMGARSWHIVTHHLLPNVIAPIIIYISFTLPAIIMTEAGLSFLGAGIAKPRPSLGQMVADGAQNITYYWHLALFPAIALALIILAFAYVADGLRDALDPSQTR